MLQAMNDHESNDEDLERREECYKILLETGSDLSSISLQHLFGRGIFWTSAFSLELSYGTLVRLLPLLCVTYKAAYHN